MHTMDDTNFPQSRLHARLEKSPYVISEVKTKAELEELGRFRYRVYIEQTGKNTQYVDHASKSLIEPLDAISTNLLARDKNGVICGAVRITLAGNGWTLPAECGSVPWDWVPSQQVAHVSRLMVEKSKKGISITTRLFHECFSWGLNHEVVFCTVFCSPLLFGWFKKFGLVKFSDEYFDQYAGEQVPTVCYLHHIDYLRAIGSPFYKVLAGKEEINPDEKCINLMSELKNKFQSCNF